MLCKQYILNKYLYVLDNFSINYKIQLVDQLHSKNITYILICFVY